MGTCLESGHGTNSVICSKLFILIDINCAKQYLKFCVFLGYFLEGRFKGFARTTPLCIPFGYQKHPCGLHVFEVFLRTNSVDLARRKVLFWPAVFGDQALKRIFVCSADGTHFFLADKELRYKRQVLKVNHNGTPSQHEKKMFLQFE